MAGNGYVPSRNILDALDKEKEAEKIRKDLQAARRKVVVENHNTRQSTKHMRDGGRSRTSSMSTAQREVKDLANQLETITGVNNYDRIGLTASGAAASMGASYAGAGGTLMKGADSLWRSGTDADITGKRGEIIAQQYNTRQNTKRSGAESSNDRSARESIRKLQQELQEITAAKEAEAMEKQLGLMKAASALEAEYERLSRKSASDIGRAKLGASGVGEFLVDTGVAGAQIAADAVANTLIPGSSIVLKGVRSFGDASQEARKAGASVGQQVARGGTKAALDLGTRKLAKSVSAYGKGLADEEITKRIVSRAKRNTTEIVSKAALSAGNGFFESFVSDMLDGVPETDYNDKANDGDFTTSAWSDMLRTAAINGILSGALSAYEDAQNVYAKRITNSFNSMTDSALQSKLRNAYIGSLKPNIIGDNSFFQSTPQNTGGWYIRRQE